MRIFVNRKIVVLLCVITFLLSGCGSREKVITRDESASGAGNSVSSAENNGNKSDKNSSKGWVFRTHNIDIEINGEAEAYMKALGQPIFYYESASCAFGDLNKVYTFEGFEMDTYSVDGKDYVSAIIFHDDTVATAEGLCIGDSAEKVKQVYGTSDSKEDRGLVYVKDDMQLCFIVENGIVKEIQYLNMMLD